MKECPVSLPHSLSLSSPCWHVIRNWKWRQENGVERNGEPLSFSRQLLLLSEWESSLLVWSFSYSSFRLQTVDLLLCKFICDQLMTPTKYTLSTRQVPTLTTHSTGVRWLVVTFQLFTTRKTSPSFTTSVQTMISVFGSIWDSQTAGVKVPFPNSLNGWMVLL